MFQIKSIIRYPSGMLHLLPNKLIILTFIWWLFTAVKLAIVTVKLGRLVVVNFSIGGLTTETQSSLWMKNDSFSESLLTYTEWFIYTSIIGHGWSQWPSGLKHEMSSPAWTLGSWVRIPLEAWMFVWVYSVFVLSCVGRGLATGWSPVQGVLPIVYKCKIREPHKRRPRPDMGCKRHWMDGWMDGWIIGH
jgi:hypothetical protein